MVLSRIRHKLLFMSCGDRISMSKLRRLVWGLMAAVLVANCGASSCATLAGDAGELEKSIRSHVKSYEAPSLFAELTRLDLAASSAAGNFKALGSWADTPVDGFGGGLDEKLLRKSINRLEEQMLEACSSTSKRMKTLQEDVQKAVLGRQLEMQKSTQALSGMASLGQSMFASNQGTDIANILMSGQGARMMESAMQGQQKATRRHQQSLADTLNSMHVPHMQSFTSEVTALASQARTLKERGTNQKRNSQERAENSLVASAEAVQRNSQGWAEDDGKENAEEERPGIEGELDTISCPHSFFTVGGQTTSHAQERCELVYLSVLACEAAYADDADQFLRRATRPLAKRLHPWAKARLRDEAGGDPALDDPSGFHVFDVDFSDRIIVAFKGSEGLSDMLTNVQFNTNSAIPGGVHSGFFKRSHAFPIEVITKMLASGKRVVITGHSLGGAVATVLTLRVHYEEVLAHEYQPNISCVTFGSPSVTSGEPGHAESFVNLVHKSDLVPRLLLLKKELYGKIASAFREVGLLKMLGDLATKAIQKAYDRLPWYGKLVADLGEHAYALWSPGDSAEDEWFAYRPFGEYVFVRSGRTVTSSQEDALDFLRMMMPNLGPEMLAASLGDHGLGRYAEELESLRARQSEASPRRKQEL